MILDTCALLWLASGDRTLSRAAQLPPIHDDPCDRFIIATAKLNGLTVVTADEHFEKYGVTVIG